MLVECRLDQQHPGRLFECHSTLFRTMLSRIDSDYFAVQRAVGILLVDQLAGSLHGPRQTTQPREPPPERAVRQRSAPGCQRMLLTIIIDEGPLLLSDGLAIGLLAAQKIFRPIQQCRADKLFATQSERADNP